MKVEMYFLKKGNSWVGCMIALVIMPLCAWWLKFLMGNLLPFYLTNSLAAFPFFYVGDLLSARIKKFSLSSGTSIIMMFVCFVVTIVLIPYVGHVSVNAVEYGNGIGWMYLAGLIGSFMIILFSFNLKEISKYHIMRVLGSGTVVLLLFQSPFLYLFKICYNVCFIYR